MSSYEEISPSTKRTLEILLEEEKTTVDKIVRITKTSRRSVYYDISNIKHLLKTLEAGELKTIDSNYFFTDDQKRILKNYIKATNTSIKKKDRIAYIICLAICEQEPVRLETLIRVLDVSRNAVLYDLSEVKMILQEYQLILVNSKRRGYYVEGDVFRKRSVFLLFVTDLIKKLSRNQLTIYDMDVVDSYTQILKKIIGQLDLKLEEEAILELVYLLLVVRNTPATYKIQLLDIKYIKGANEFKLVDKYFPEMRTYEKIYLSICLLEYKNNRQYMKENLIEEIRIQDCAKKLVEIFERISCVDFERRNELIDSLYLHMKLSYYNYCYIVPTVNPLLNEIKENYPDLFSMVELSCIEMKEDLPYLIGESEISYFTMHFGAYLHSARKKLSQAHVLITCLNVTTSSRLLKMEIEEQFDNIVIVDMVQPQNIDSYPRYREIDFVISTVNFECSIPMITVHPILTAEDKANIATLMMMLNINSKSDSQQFKAFLKIVRQNVDDETYMTIKKELNRYLNSQGSLVTIPKNKKITLHDMLSEYGVTIEDEKENDWEKAVRETSDVLLKRGCIEERYVERMIQLGRENGPYFVISDEIAIAHASPEDGAKQLSVSLCIYKNGLTIMGKREVHFLFVLSTTNRQEHLHILKNMMTLNENPLLMQQLCCAKCEEDALCIFDGIR